MHFPRKWFLRSEFSVMTTQNVTHLTALLLTLGKVKIYKFCTVKPCKHKKHIFIHTVSCTYICKQPIVNSMWPQINNNKLK